MKKDEFIDKIIKQNLSSREDYKKPKKYPLPFAEKKVMVTGMGKRKHHTEAQKAVNDLIQQWR